MKKVIEQEVFTNVHIEVTSKTLHFTQKSAYPNSVVIEKSKAREVALAICPELESELSEKRNEIEGFAIGFSEWFILNGIEKARIDGHYWVRGNIYLNKTELIELYKQSLNK